MKLNVHVLGKHVAVLESLGDFKSVLTYVPDAQPEDLVSLTMPVRTESYHWKSEIPPFFRMNLPEGYLLQILQEKFGPEIGASALNLLSVVGRNMVGRVQVAPPGAVLDEPARSIEVAELLKGDNSEQAFTELVREHARSGVSGVLPKFLDTEENKDFGLGSHQKVSFLTHRHIIKGSSERLPYASANEYLCMCAAKKIVDSAKVELSDDGKVLVVHRFDVDQQGRPHLALEDFCSLLGLEPKNKYETTWERITTAARDHIEGKGQRDAFLVLAKVLLLTYAFKNADCHSKNLAMIYSRPEDARMSPVYDMLTTTVYADYQYKSPGIMFMGRKTWAPGKNLAKFIMREFNLSEREQKGIVEQIGDALADTAPTARELMKRLPEFQDTGTRMLSTWNQQIQDLRDSKTYAMSPSKLGDAFADLAEVPKLKSRRRVIGKSELLADRSKPRKK